MTRKPILLLALLGMALCLIPACADDDAATPGIRPLGTIMGRVIDISIDEPIPNCTVTITTEPFTTDTTGTGEVVITTSTDAEGLFYRDDVPNGEVEVKVKRDGYRTPETQMWALSPGGMGEFLFEMAPGEDPPEKHEGDEQNARPPDWGARD